MCQTSKRACGSIASKQPVRVSKYLCLEQPAVACLWDCLTSDVCTVSDRENTRQGCTDVLASNYDATARVDSGTCAYPTSCLAFAGTMLAHYRSRYKYATGLHVNASDMCMLVQGSPFNVSRFTDTSLITEPADAATESCTATDSAVCQLGFAS